MTCSSAKKDHEIVSFRGAEARTRTAEGGRPYAKQVS